jgi:hypothetical protein
MFRPHIATNDPVEAGASICFFSAPKVFLESSAQQFSTCIKKKYCYHSTTQGVQTRKDCVTYCRKRISRKLCHIISVIEDRVLFMKSRSQYMNIVRDETSGKYQYFLDIFFGPISSHTDGIKIRSGVGK